MESAARVLIIAGLCLAAVGALLHFAPSVPWLGKLPGDLRIERPGFRLFVPITTCLVISAALNALIWLASKLR